MKRWFLRAELVSLERYIAILRREGWTWFELQQLSHEAESLRVRIACIRPLDWKDITAQVAAVVSVVALAAIGVWRWLH